MEQRREPDWRGITAAILAVGIFAVILAADIIAGINDYRQVTAEEVATVSTVLGAAVGAIAVYLGTRKTNGHKGPDDPDEPTK